jgi:hypothetical protein
MYGPVVQRWTGLPGMAQNATVTGKVTSAEDGAALPGVTVLEKGTTNGTSTTPGATTAFRWGTTPLWCSASSAWPARKWPWAAGQPST